MEIKYYPQVITKDIPALDRSIRARVHDAIEQKLGTSPFTYGLPLRANLKNLWKLRVGEWRVVYTINGSEVHIIAIGHRKEIYKLITTRI